MPSRNCSTEAYWVQATTYATSTAATVAWNDPVPTTCSYTVLPGTWAAAGNAATTYVVSSPVWSEVAEEALRDAPDPGYVRDQLAAYAATYDPNAGLTEDEIAERDAAHAERVREFEEQERERLRRQTERLAARMDADARALETLRSLLTAEQRAAIATEGYLPVTGSEGNLFRLMTDRSDGNVYWVDETGVELGQMCAHPARQGFPDGGRLPLGDVLIGQLLALTADERSFVATANRYAGSLPEYSEVPAA